MFSPSYCKHYLALFAIGKIGIVVLSRHGKQIIMYGHYMSSATTDQENNE